MPPKDKLGKTYAVGQKVAMIINRGSSGGAWIEVREVSQVSPLRFGKSAIKSPDSHLILEPPWE